ncbi:hypothetical protein EMIHUDRAFT_244273 [Emiliania huxleyi CCMP1516]|uniref:Methyltransferase domain-containing protein n=2 Tax=Emiliania huxleyi TaxID=2903 RepID=A0A0D3IPG8_EMIH1|nr:hypothetical protein EMIHUDRAFT_212897 [Emiliania huxleyi CCMP1516]XP_005769645.1 hypothetical protein EMIHUDRAFT_244273 [Emiliania huxleyi CCMP1516]EOD13153.1 hypothetical protein EMIHUDRAFT_212897 [Emiliania huxleyi CCMP1516]EOD17216.1 hypothetical protein EMIHUDRAFT_244273 [Emiliania huxleyi CCMP1516]|eukprot:XP_005765582.1 hypothetical protein EMIHUDRAFT_212897 [Emiliania huxleyi CCMP1516]
MGSTGAVDYETVFDWRNMHWRPPPPPAEWRSRSLNIWRGRDWSASWRDAKSETALEKRLYQAIPHWTDVINGDSPHARRYWANGTLPTRVAAPGGAGRSERLACPSNPGARTPLHASQPECEAWWPVDTRCVAYVIGVGDLPKGRQDAWGFPIHAAKRGCIVHAYDPTIALRQRQQAAAQQIALKLRKGRQHGNLTFHFAGLGAGRSRNTINSFGAIDGTVLYTMAELVAANKADGGWPTILSIDCEGCEWAALEQMAADPRALKILGGVKLLFLDAHLSPTMLPPTPRQFVVALELLFHRLGFRLRWLRSVDGFPADQKVADFLGVAGLPAGFCCYEMVLVR